MPVKHRHREQAGRGVVDVVAEAVLVGEARIGRVVHLRVRVGIHGAHQARLEGVDDVRQGPGQAGAGEARRPRKRRAGGHHGVVAGVGPRPQARQADAVGARVPGTVLPQVQVDQGDVGFAVQRGDLGVRAVRQRERPAVPRRVLPQPRHQRVCRAVPGLAGRHVVGEVASLGVYPVVPVGFPRRDAHRDHGMPRGDAVLGVGVEEEQVVVGVGDDLQVRGVRLGVAAGVVGVGEQDRRRRAPQGQRTRHDRRAPGDRPSQQDPPPHLHGSVMLSSHDGIDASRSSSGCRCVLIETCDDPHRVAATMRPGHQS